jgi:hypothetical protein
MSINKLELLLLSFRDEEHAHPALGSYLLSGAPNRASPSLGRHIAGRAYELGVGTKPEFVFL